MPAKAVTKSVAKSGSITLTVRQAIGVFNAQSQLPKLPDQKIAYTLGYIADKCEQQFRTFNRERAKLHDQMSQSVEVAVPDQPGKTETVPKVPASKQAEYEKRLEEMLDIEFTINRAPVKLDDLLGTGREGVEPVLLTSDQYRALMLVVIE